MAEKMTLNMKEKIVLKEPRFRNTKKVYQSNTVHMHNPTFEGGGGGLAQIKSK